jgi:hypothetical protein
MEEIKKKEKFPKRMNWIREHSKKMPAHSVKINQNLGDYTFEDLAKNFMPKKKT